MITDLLTSLLHDLKVDGKFNQNQMYIGRGIDEQITIQLSGGSAAIRYVPATASESAKIQFTADGTTWLTLGDSVADVEPILFNSTDLDSSGLLHIQHNLATLTGLSYTIEPRAIANTNGVLVLDYSENDTSLSGGAVWFDGSRQSMLVASGLTPSSTTGIQVES